MTSPTVKNEARTYKDIRADYSFDPSVFNNEPERLRTVKEIIANELTPAEQTFIILYADFQSYRKLGKRFGLSHMTVRKEIIRIREKIKSKYNERLR